MAIVFEKQKKTQKNFILILIVVFLITIFVVWQGFFKKETKIFFETLTPTKKEIKINFEILKNPLLETLQSFSAIKPFEETPSTPGKPGEKLGRENPFIPY